MYVDVLLPLYLDKLLTYYVPALWNDRIVIGGRVAVSIGPSKVMSAIVMDKREEVECPSAIKSIIEIIDTKPVVTEEQMRLWKWIAEYYLCTLGEVMKYFLPASMRIRGKIEEDGVAFESSQSITTRRKLYYESPLPDGTRAKKQAEALALVAERGSLWRSKLSQAGFSDTIIRALIAAGHITEHEEHVFGTAEEANIIDPEHRLNELSEAQQQAKEEIAALSRNGKPTLLFGVPGSGKTEIYLHRIAETLKSGKTALIILPELAVTTQLTERIEKSFPGAVATYNSMETTAKRYRTYNRILSGEAKVIVGTRIAVALPFRYLGLVVADEEHDASYKQNDKRPFFNARDTAAMMGSIYGCDVLLVSATPSIESYYNCERGKYSLVKLSERFGNLPAPKIEIIDRRHIALKDKQTYGYHFDTRYFSKLMLRRIGETLENHDQALILQNRRGFANYLECEKCSYTPSCSRCNVTLTLHKGSGLLECHYCGHRERPAEKCPECKGKMLLHGAGAENVEERIESYFPQSRVARLDGDAMKSPKSFKKTVLKIAKGEIDIIVGTQIIAKGFDFPHAKLACAINIDTSLNYPDFRSAERTFQLLTQFAGRTSRHKSGGETIIQTSHPENKLFRFIQNSDFESMYQSELEERKTFIYPPICRMIRITMRHTNHQILKEAAAKTELSLKEELGDIVGNAEAPLIEKIRDLHILNILIKIPRERNSTPIKEITAQITSDINRKSYREKIMIEINVDV